MGPYPRFMIEIVRGVDAHLPGLWELLRQAGLPADVGGHGGTAIILATEEGEVVGGVALEVYGRHGLLRSLVVAQERRSGGLGGRLTGAAVDEAVGRGLEAVYLLTETAADFFRRLGFSVTERDLAPEGIQASSEFGVLCPDTAVPMVLSL